MRLLFLYWQSWTVVHLCVACLRHAIWKAKHYTYVGAEYMCLGLQHSRVSVSVSVASVWFCLFPFTNFRSLNFFGFVFKCLPSTLAKWTGHLFKQFRWGFLGPLLAWNNMLAHDIFSEAIFECLPLGCSFGSRNATGRSKPTLCFALPTFLKVCLWPSNRSSAPRRSGRDLLQILECYMVRPYTVFLKTHRLYSWESLLTATGFNRTLSHLSISRQSWKPTRARFRDACGLHLADCLFVVLADVNLEWAQSEPRILRTAPPSSSWQILL